jgi:hypothetical protein
MKNSAIELHDSSIEAITNLGDQVFLFMHAYLHQSDGMPGVDKGSGWIQAVIISFTNSTIVGNNKQYPINISDGKLIIGKRTIPNLISILFVGDDVDLKLDLVNAEHICIKGTRAELTLLGNPKYVEEFHP